MTKNFKELNEAYKKRSGNFISMKKYGEIMNKTQLVMNSDLA